MSFLVMTDSAANLPVRLLQEHGIPMIPYLYLVNNREEHEDGTVDFDGRAYYQAMREGTPVTTTQIVPGRYIEWLEPYLAAGNDILYLSMSSGISGSYASSCIARAELIEKYPERRLEVFDTKAASLGEGLQVLKAVGYRDEGRTLDETLALLEEERKMMYQVFTVDELKYLRKTGRICGVVAAVGTVLNIKPVLKGNENGQIVQKAKVRGRKHAIRALADSYNELVRNAGANSVGIAHADCPEDARQLIELLNEKYPPKEILTVCYEPVTGSHVGPGTLALFFYGDADVRYH